MVIKEYFHKPTFIEGPLSPIPVMQPVVIDIFDSEIRYIFESGFSVSTAGNGNALIVVEEEDLETGNQCRKITIELSRADLLRLFEYTL